MLAGDYQRIATASDVHCCPMSNTSDYRERGFAAIADVPLHKLYGDLMRLTQAGVKSAQYPHDASEIAQAAI
jgi:hypothetical protein